jgi:hypothetical protein
MRAAKFLLAVLALTLLAGVGEAEKKAKKPEVPEVMATAKTVAVVSREGGEFELRVNEEERMAIAAVRDGLKAWGRYTVVADASQADVVLVVTKAKPAKQDRLPARELNRDGSNGTPGGIQLGNGTDSVAQMREGLTAQLEGSLDTLAVCVRDAKGRMGNPVWSRSMEGGLGGMRPALLDQLRLAVEKAYLVTAAKP